MSQMPNVNTYTSHIIIVLKIAQVNYSFFQSVDAIS